MQKFSSFQDVRVIHERTVTLTGTPDSPGLPFTPGTPSGPGSPYTHSPTCVTIISTSVGKTTNNFSGPDRAKWSGVCVSVYVYELDDFDLDT